MFLGTKLILECFLIFKLNFHNWKLNSLFYNFFFDYVKYFEFKACLILIDKNFRKMLNYRKSRWELRIFKLNNLRKNVLLRVRNFSSFFAVIVMSEAL